MKLTPLLFCVVACSGTVVTPPGTKPTPPTCSAEDSTAIGTGFMNGTDPAGYPSFAVDGCLLTYINPAGALAQRTLGQDNEKILVEAARSPKRPSSRDGLLVWEYQEGGIAKVGVLDTRTEQRFTLRGGFKAAGEPRSTGTGVVFTGWLTPDENGDTDVFFAARGSESADTVFDGPGQQRFADGNGTTLAASDFSEDPSGAYAFREARLSDIVVRQNTVLSKRVKAGKQAFPLVLGDNEIAYLDWDSIHPEPKLAAYDLYRAALDRPPTDDLKIELVMAPGNYLRPSAVGATLFYINNNPMTGDAAVKVQRPGQMSERLTAGSFAAVVAVSTDSAFAAEFSQNGALSLRTVRMGQ
jgi:hypothetical protein